MQNDATDGLFRAIKSVALGKSYEDCNFSLIGDVEISKDLIYTIRIGFAIDLNTYL